MIALLGDLYSAAYGYVNALMIRLAFPAEACLVYLALELALPRGPRNSVHSYLRAVRITIAWIAINTVLLGIAKWLAQPADFAPLGVLDLRALTESDNLALRIGGWVVAAFAISIAGNFFYYWLHRAQHGVPLLWRFHRVHHSIREMSAANSYHHFTEDLFQYAAVSMPLAFLLGLESGPVPWIVLAIASTHSYFIHSSTAISLGPLRYVLGDNRYHRLHHSLDQRHFGRNFGTYTPLWDLLFGTACLPRRGEWPAVGLEDTPEPLTVRDYLLMPLRPIPVSPSGRLASSDQPALTSQ